MPAAEAARASEDTASNFQPNHTTTHTHKKMKTYAAYAPASNGQQVAIATTEATTLANAKRALANFIAMVAPDATVRLLED